MSMQFAKLATTRYSNAAARTIRAAGIQGPQAYDYLFSSSQVNYLGLYPINTALAAIETCMTEAEFIGYIEKFEAAGFVKFDRVNWLVWVIEGAERNIGELKQTEGKKADNKVVMVNKAFKLVPAASPLKAEFYARYSAMLKLDGYSAPAPAQAPVASATPAAPVAAPVAAPARPVAPPPAPAPLVAFAPAKEADVRLDELDPALVSSWGYKDLLKMLSNLRSLDRSEHPAATDAQFNARAARLLDDLGTRGATDCLDWSMRNRDLALDATMARVYPKEFAPAEYADI